MKKLTLIISAVAATFCCAFGAAGCGSGGSATYSLPAEASGDLYVYDVTYELTTNDGQSVSKNQQVMTVSQQKYRLNLDMKIGTLIDWNADTRIYIKTTFENNSWFTTNWEQANTSKVETETTDNSISYIFNYSLPETINTAKEFPIELSFTPSDVGIAGVSVEVYTNNSALTLAGSTSTELCLNEENLGITISDETLTVNSSYMLRSLYIPSYVTSITCDNKVNIAKVIFAKRNTIPESMLENYTSITSVTIPNGVTDIGEYAFYNCSKLTSITIPDSVTSIGSSAFKDCSSLTYNEYDNAYYLGNNTNKYVVLMKAVSTDITSCTINANTKFIYDSAFKDCTSLASITIPDSVTGIGSSAFEDCTSLTSITISDNVTSIGSSAFEDCTSLTYNEYDNAYYLGNDTNPYVALIEAKSTDITSCTINENTEVIYSNAFSGCTALTSITIPDSVTSIGSSAFGYCTSLTSITVDDNNANYKSIDGNLYSKDGITLIRYAIGKTDTAFTIPDSVTSIGSSAFNGCTSLTSITIGNGVTSIGSLAFRQCTSLTNIIIPDSVTSIGVGAFYNCTSLTSITIGSGVTSIGSLAFYNCTALTEINYNATECADLSSISLFYCTGLSGDGITVNIGANVTKIPAYLFYQSSYGLYAAKITSVMFAEGSKCTSIGDYAFFDCAKLTGITIPDSVTSIGYSAFRNCTALTSVTFKNTTGWWYASSSSATSGKSLSSSSLTDTSAAATYLTSTYSSYYWKRT